MENIEFVRDTELEESILCSCLTVPDAADFYCQRVFPTDFYLKSHEYIFQSILEVYRETGSVDAVKVSSYLRQSSRRVPASNISKLLDADTSVDFDFCVRRLKEMSTSRRLAMAAHATMKRALDPTVPVSEVTGFFMSEVDEIEHYGVIPKTASRASDLAVDSSDRYDEVSRNPGLPGISTGITRLDYKIGGLIKKTLTVLAARPSMGKTALALNIAKRTAALGHKVAFFELEMGRNQIYDRLVADTASIGLRRLTMGPLDPSDLEAISRANEHLHDLPLVVDDDSSVNVNDIIARCDQYRQNLGGLDLVIIDHLQLVPSMNAKSNNRNVDIGQITSMLKGTLAKKMDTAVMLLSQLNRSCEARKPPVPHLADLRESGNIEQDADVVMFIFRPKYYQMQEDYANQADLIVAKARQGEVGVVPLVFHDVYTRFTALEG